LMKARSVQLLTLANKHIKRRFSANPLYGCWRGALFMILNGGLVLAK
jgi:hypothetical protein